MCKDLTRWGHKETIALASTHHVIPVIVHNYACNLIYHNLRRKIIKIGVPPLQFLENGIKSARDIHIHVTLIRLLTPHTHTHINLHTYAATNASLNPFTADVK